jgi:7-cyano-7-deazaguanine synthase in queuosine biosynthesis
MYACLITPGIDSSLSYFYLREKIAKGEDIKLIYIPISKKYSDIEITRIKLMEKYFERKVFIYPFNNSLINEDKNAFIAGRNTLLATLVESSINERPLRIVFGFTADDRVYDSGKEFMDKLTSIQSSEVSCMAPAIDITKSRLVRWFFEEYKADFNKEDFSKLLYSCYEGKDEPCGCCKACIRAATSLYPYVDIKLKESVLPQLKNLLEDYTISEERRRSIVNYVGSHFSNTLF